MSRKWIFLSYISSVKGYKLLCSKIGKKVISGDVVFDELEMVQNLSLRDFDKTEQHNQST